MKAALNKAELTYQLVPPHIHRENKAERAIQTLKGHLKAGLATLDPDFPIQEWDRLIDQSKLTLNLLRASKFNPKLSACLENSIIRKILLHLPEQKIEFTQKQVNGVRGHQMERKGGQ